MYAITKIRFYIAFAVSTLSQFANNPAPEHLAAVKRISDISENIQALESFIRKLTLCCFTDTLTQIGQ